MDNIITQENQQENQLTKFSLEIIPEMFSLNLKSMDIIILAKIFQFKSKGLSCYITNQQLSEMLNESESTIKRALDRLESMKYIQRKTIYIKSGNLTKKKRELQLCFNNISNIPLCPISCKNA